MIRRADQASSDLLVETFVDVGSLSVLLESYDHQIIFGRRGTGKTHAFRYHARRAEEQGDCVIFIDMRSLGSDRGIYEDERLPLTERGTRLLSDAMTAVHEGMSAFVSNTVLDEKAISDALNELNAFADEMRHLSIDGQIELESTRDDERRSQRATAGGLALGHGVGLSASHDRGLSQRSTTQEKMRSTGLPRHHVRFGRLSAPLQSLVQLIDPAHVWVLFDEWSAVPSDLQPMLADLIRRVLLPVSGVTVKIGAIAHRSHFVVTHGPGDYIGVELGADMAADIDLDEFLAFDYDADSAAGFYASLVTEHVRAAAAAYGAADVPSDETELLEEIFTQRGALDELARAAEGVPRDAMSILHRAAQRAGADRITVRDITLAAHVWHEHDKERNLDKNVRVRDAWRRVVDIVLRERHARAFALEEEEAQASRRIGALYDQRLLHLIKRNVVSRDRPGSRYYIFGIDYGHYAGGADDVSEGLFEFIDETGERFWAQFVRDEYPSLEPAVLPLRALDEKGSPKEISKKEDPRTVLVKRRPPKDMRPPEIIRDLMYRLRTETGEVMELELSYDGREGALSRHSPVGLALRGKQVGQSIEVHAPGGTWKAEIIEIRLVEQ